MHASPPMNPAPTVRVEHFELRAADGCGLGATLFSPPNAARGTVIIHGATATPQSYYRRFAYFLAGEIGLRVLSYDYRGIGRSRPRSLRGYRASMSEWALLDAAAAHAYVAERFAGEPVAWVGHSFGGQLVGALDAARHASAAVMVGAQLAYYRNWPRLGQLRLQLIWRVLMPLFARVFGYVPGRLGLGADLPAGVAIQWARWCMHPEYLGADHHDARARFARFDLPLLFYSFADDDYAPEAATRSLLDRLSGARLQRVHVHPRDHGGLPIGHFGFFRSRFAETLWPATGAFLRDALQQSADGTTTVGHDPRFTSEGAVGA